MARTRLARTHHAVQATFLRAQQQDSAVVVLQQLSPKKMRRPSTPPPPLPPASLFSGTDTFGTALTLTFPKTCPPAGKLATKVPSPSSDEVWALTSLKKKHAETARATTTEIDAHTHTRTHHQHHQHPHQHQQEACGTHVLRNGECSAQTAGLGPAPLRPGVWPQKSYSQGQVVQGAPRLGVDPTPLAVERTSASAVALALAFSPFPSPRP